MQNPNPVNLQTDEEIKALGWPVWARDEDGHLMSMCARMENDDEAFGETLLEWFDLGWKIINAKHV